MTTLTQMDLAQFTGTEHWYKHFLGLLYTDGVKSLAEKAGAYWLIDAIASYLPIVRKTDNDFMVWELKTFDNKVTLIAKTDTDQSNSILHAIEFTNFPLVYIKLYQCNGVLLLPSEY